MMGIAEQVAGLEVVLRAEENLYLRLREVLRREEQELVALDPAEIATIVDQKQSLVEEGRLLEDSRRALTLGLGRALGLGDGAIPVSGLIASLAGEAGELPELQARLSALIRGTRSLLESNGAFSERSLRRVQETLRMLGRAVPEKVGYGPGISRGDPTLGRGRLVRAAI
jgi:flagellar biosynthesis/type III secretory pathway chaperone